MSHSSHGANNFPFDKVTTYASTFASIRMLIMGLTLMSTEQVLKRQFVLRKRTILDFKQRCHVI